MYRDGSRTGCSDPPVALHSVPATVERNQDETFAGVTLQLSVTLTDREGAPVTSGMDVSFGIRAPSPRPSRARSGPQPRATGSQTEATARVLQVSCRRVPSGVPCT